MRMGSVGGWWLPVRSGRLRVWRDWCIVWVWVWVWVCVCVRGGDFGCKGFLWERIGGFGGRGGKLHAEEE